jgi:hypothetical protein
MTIEQIMQIVLSAVATIVTGLAAWGVKVFTSWLTSNIKNEKAKQLIESAADIIVSATKCTTQTYVDALKDKDLFNEEAQKAALEKTKEVVLTQLTDETKELIEQTYGDITKWIETKIESSIYDLKNSVADEVAEAAE